MEKRPVDMEKLMAFLSGDKFAQACGIVIDEVEEGRSRCSMKVTPMHINGWGAVMGGAVFSLADYAFAAAVNVGHTCYGEPLTVSRDINITFLRPAKGDKLVAEAVIEHSGRTACFARVDVYDQRGKTVAVATVNGAKAG